MCRTVFTTVFSEAHSKESPVSLDDSDIEARLNSWNLGIENPRYLRQKPLPVSLVGDDFTGLFSKDGYL
ncbi:centrosomal protein [Cricetulus griseus]|nr:centrosomal protein [Cricetulus griseus]